MNALKRLSPGNNCSNDVRWHRWILSVDSMDRRLYPTVNICHTEVEIWIHFHMSWIMQSIVKKNYIHPHPTSVSLSFVFIQNPCAGMQQTRACSCRDSQKPWYFYLHCRVIHPTCQESLTPHDNQGGKKVKIFLLCVSFFSCSTFLTTLFNSSAFEVFFWSFLIID